jgi:predicted Zn-dependent peptidase
MNLDPYRNEKAPRREVLPGGAVLLSVPMVTAHAVTFGVWLRTGSQDEPGPLGGISHFLEHMVFKGTDKRSAFEVASTFDRLGASVDAFTTKDMVAFTVKVLPEYFEAVVELMAEMLLKPAFESHLVQLEQDVVVEEIQEAADTPEDRLHDAFAGRLYGKHARSRPILGFAATVRNFNSEVLHAEHARLFTGSNLVISMAGNIREGFVDILRKNFATGTEPVKAEPTLEEPSVSAPAASLMDLSMEEADPFRLDLFSPIIQTYFEIGNLAVSYDHRDRIPVFLVTNLLGGGMSSRVFQAVREREGLAYTVYNYSDMGRGIGLVSCAGSCSPEKMDRLEDIIRLEYDRLISAGLDKDELANNTAQIKSQLIFSLEGMVNQMFRSARNEIFYGRFIPVAELVDRIDSVTPEDIARCAETYFHPESLLIATHGPEMLEEQE